MMEEQNNAWCSVVPLSQWRLREVRHKEARDKDKIRIKRLEQHCNVLEGALICWQQWCWKLLEKEEGPARAAKKKEDVAEGSSNNKRQHVECSVIDYSRWGHLGNTDWEHEGEAEYGEENMKLMRSPDGMGNTKITMMWKKGIVGAASRQCSPLE